MTNLTETRDPMNPTVLELPADFLGCDAEALKQELLAALVRARPVELRGGGVARAGTASLQLLLAFLREAERRGVPVRLSAPSAQLLDALRVLGLERADELARVLGGAEG